MGQKVNPHGLRVGVIKNWDSRWFAKDEVFGDTLVSDYNIRKYLKKALQDAGVPKIEIERDSHRVRVFVHCAKPGMVIGRGGEQIDKYKQELEAMVGMPVALNVVEVRQPDMNAQLVAENNFHMDASKLYVSECFVTPGPTLKRMMPRAKGSADRILKRTSHVTIVVAERD